MLKPQAVGAQISRRGGRIFLVLVFTLGLLCAGWLFHDVELRHRLRDGLSSFRQNINVGNHSKNKDKTDGFTGSLIPSKIWQVMLPKRGMTETHVEPDNIQDTSTWLAHNPDYQYTLVGKKGADEFVHRHFAKNPTILDLYGKLPNVGMKSDFLRYLLLSVEGGVYTDTDTMALKPISQWVPPHLSEQVRLIVGIEWDELDGGRWQDMTHAVQFCQWTIAAAPGHPVFDKMAARVIQSLGEIAATHQQPVEELHPNDFEVLNSTGPVAWTDVVFEYMQEQEPELKDTKQLGYAKDPRLVGDVLLLPIDGFGMGQPHSNSAKWDQDNIPEAALAKHNFRGSWRGDKKKKKKRDKWGRCLCR